MAKGSSSKPAAPRSASQQIEQDLVRSALEKHKRGEKPTRAELTALRKFERQREAAALDTAIRACPKKLYVQLTGRQHKVLLDQADRHQLPLQGDTVDLAAVLRRFHDILADNRHRLAAGPASDDPLLDGEETPALERYRKLKGDLLALELAERNATLIPREDVSNIFAQLADTLRQTAERLRDHHGHDAADLLNDAIESITHTVSHNDLDDAADTAKD